MFVSLKSNILIKSIFCSCIFFRLTFAATNYCAISSCNKNLHTLCHYNNSRPSSNCNGYIKASLTASEKFALVNKHNELRRKVANGQEKRGKPGPQPSASNMRILVWDDELAQIAQRWADQCINGHDRCRNVERFVVGQNIVTYWSTAKLNKTVESLVEDWYNEVKLFNGNSVTEYRFDSSIGHYSQLVWAKTKYVGCARIVYRNLGLYVVRLICNYGPSGNYIGEQVYKIGKPASDCSTNHANEKLTGLCN